jgi:hypothetical protein
MVRSSGGPVVSRDYAVEIFYQAGWVAAATVDLTPANTDPLYKFALRYQWAKWW